MASPKIQNVSDTALWVATYRAHESDRPDALFNDPYAARLAGERGHAIAANARFSMYVSWSVVIRTVVIDDFVQRLVRDGVDTVVNLGAGLDTRPYRLALPSSLRWIEVDFPHVIALKNEKLASDQPTCRLERVALDLSNDEARAAWLAKTAGESKRVLVITEGVAPYLTEDQVARLAKDLRAHAAYRHWITDYFDKRIMRHYQKPAQRQQMQNAPFRFWPDDWFAFYAGCGWGAKEIRYLGEESVRLGRPLPMNGFWKFIFTLFPYPSPMLRSLAYVLLEPQ